MLTNNDLDYLTEAKRRLTQAEELCDTPMALYYITQAIEHLEQAIRELEGFQ